MKKILTILILLGVVTAGVWYFKREKPNNIDLAAFKKIADESICAERGISFYLIDSEYVFVNRQGDCPDNSYSYQLYGKSTTPLLCSQNDSIFGAQTHCNEESVQEIFEIIVENQDRADLGLGGVHDVRELKF